MSMQNSQLRPFPRVVRIEPSAACNLACSHCPTGTVKMTRGIMPPERFARVLANIERHLDDIKVVVLYHGGEPLLNKHFLNMLRAVKALGIPFVKTVSNGMLLDEAAAAGIVDAGLDAIEFSLDGTSPEDNDFIRRNAAFTKIAANIKRLIACKQQRGANRPEIFLASTQFLGEGDDPSVDPPPPAWLVREFGEPGDAIAGFKCNWAFRWPDMVVLRDRYEVRNPAPQAEPGYECDHVQNTLTVTSNGDVVSCCYDLTHQQVMGNVDAEDLAGIWNGPRYRGLRGGIASGDFPPLCRNCNVASPAACLVRIETPEVLPA